MNRGPLVSEATTLPTQSQPLSLNIIDIMWITCSRISTNTKNFYISEKDKDCLWCNYKAMSNTSQLLQQLLLLLLQLLLLLLLLQLLQRFGQFFQHFLSSLMFEFVEIMRIAKDKFWFNFDDPKRLTQSRWTQSKIIFWWSSVWPDWVIFESSWQQICCRSSPKEFLTYGLFKNDQFI